jgi:hypothetical protein
VARACSCGCPSPFPAAGTRPQYWPAFSQRKKRMQCRIFAQRWANSLIAVFSFFEVGSGQGAKWLQAAKGRRPTTLQLEYAAGLVDDLVHWTRSPPEVFLACDRGRKPRIVELAGSLGAMQYGKDCSLQKLATTALSVDLSRIALPEKAGQLRPEGEVPEPLGSQCLDIDGRVDAREDSGPLPRACHRVAVDDEVRLAMQLYDAGVGCLVEKHHLRRRVHAGCSFRDKPRIEWAVSAGGWFSVRHKPDRDRLIYDRRPMNCVTNRLS